MSIMHSAAGQSVTRWQLAVEQRRRHLLANPRDWVSWNDGSNALWLLDEPLQAESWARRAVSLQPDHPSVWRTWGNALTDLGDYPRAASAYQSSLRLLDSPETAFNYSKVLGALGAYQEALRFAERRLDHPDWKTGCLGPCWTGWPEARRLVVWSEQGFGDVIQALRWLLPLQLCWPGLVEVQVEPCMVPLVQQGMAWLPRPVKVRHKAENAFAPVRGNVCQGSILSLGALLGVDLVSEGWRQGGYLKVPSPVDTHRGRRPRVGLVWASGRFLDGHVQEREYNRKSLFGSDLLVLLQALSERPIELVNLQFGPDRCVSDAYSGVFEDSIAPDADFLDTARQIKQLDLLISVDTAAAHLAGAMAIPVWLLLPWAAEARWGKTASTTPWYPTAKLIRQPEQRDWRGAIMRLLAHLDLWLCSW